MNPRPSFQPPLGPGIAAYLDLMQALGREFRTETAVLADLDRFLFERRASTLDSSGFAAWAVTLARYTPTVRRSRMRIVRNLCLYLRRSDPTCFVPDPGGFPPPGQRPRPFIFSEGQILALLREADKLPATPGSPLRAEVYRLAIVLRNSFGSVSAITIGSSARFSSGLRSSTSRARWLSPPMPHGKWTPTSPSGADFPAHTTHPCWQTVSARNRRTPELAWPLGSATYAALLASLPQPGSRPGSTTSDTPMPSMSCCAGTTPGWTRKPSWRSLRRQWGMFPRPRRPTT